MKIKFFADIRTNFKSADFWMIRRGGLDSVGRVTRDFYKEHIGIKIFRKDLVLPEYLYYALMHVYLRGDWKSLAKGSLLLVNLRTEDVKNLDIFED